MKRVVSIMVVVVLALGGGAAGAKSKGPSTVVVRGGWVNDAPCLLLDPASVKPGSGTPPQDIQLTCTGTTLWNGGFTGRTVIEGTARADTVGNIHGTADEWFYGVYTADNRVGGLHMTHRFSVDGATGGFVRQRCSGGHAISPAPKERASSSVTRCSAATPGTGYRRRGRLPHQRHVFRSRSRKTVPGSSLKGEP